MADDYAAVAMVISIGFIRFLATERNIFIRSQPASWLLDVSSQPRIAENTPDSVILQADSTTRGGNETVLQDTAYTPSPTTGTGGSSELCPINES